MALYGYGNCSLSKATKRKTSDLHMAPEGYSHQALCLVLLNARRIKPQIQTLFHQNTFLYHPSIHTHVSSTWLFLPNVRIQFTCRSANRQSTKKRTYQLLYIHSIPRDDGLQTCPKLVEVDCRNKLRINIASSWFSLRGCIEIQGQKNIKRKKIRDKLGRKFHFSCTN